jgi:hypothetical protein
VSLGRNHARPRCTARVRPTATWAYPSSASAGQRSAWRRCARRRRGTAASRRRPHRRTGDGRGNVAGLTGAWTAARHDGVDGGVGWLGERGRRQHGGSATTDGELQGRVRGLAWTETQETRGCDTLTGFGQRRSGRRDEAAWSDSSCSGAVGELGVRSDSGCPNGAVGAAFNPPGTFGHRRP